MEKSDDSCTFDVARGMMRYSKAALLDRPHRVDTKADVGTLMQPPVH